MSARPLNFDSSTLPCGDCASRSPIEVAGGDRRSAGGADGLDESLDVWSSCPLEAAARGTELTTSSSYERLRRDFATRARRGQTAGDTDVM